MILTEDEIWQIGMQEISLDAPYGYARAIESAVLEKLKTQKPVAWLFDTDQEALLPEEIEPEPFNLRPELYTPLYTHPLPPDDVVRDAERYKWLRKVAPNMYWDNHDKEIGFVRFDTKAYLWKPEMFDAAIDKAIGESE